MRGGGRDDHRGQDEQFIGQKDHTVTVPGLFVSAWLLGAPAIEKPHLDARRDSIKRATRAFSVRSSRSTLRRCASATRSPRCPRRASSTIASRTASDWFRPDSVSLRSASWASTSSLIEIAFCIWYVTTV